MSRRREDGQDDGGPVLHGVNPVLEALERRPGEVDRVLVAREGGGGRLGRLLRTAREAGVPVSHVPRAVLAAALGTIAAVAPLLGLFGTVTGMIDVFRTIAQSGVGQAAELSGGISQALVTTAFGLLVAIPALVGYNYFTARVDAMVTELERESLRVVRGLYGGSSSAALPVERPAVVKD